MCGASLYHDAQICPYHHSSDLDWPVFNRIMCDLLHRGVEPARLPLGEREDLMPDYSSAAEA